MFGDESAANEFIDNFTKKLEVSFYSSLVKSNNCNLCYYFSC